MPKTDKNGYMPQQRQIKQLMDLGTQVQIHHGRGDDEAAHSAEIKLKTEALQMIVKARAPRDSKMLHEFIRHTRTLAKFGLATTKLNFSRRTA